MPVYLFQCPQCRNQFEEIQKYYDPNPRCPICDAPTIRIPDAPSVRFKGSGFHCTDYTHHGRRKANV